MVWFEDASFLVRHREDGSFIRREKGSISIQFYTTASIACDGP